MSLPHWAEEWERATYTLASGEVIVRSWDNVNKGLIPVEELDDEELAREKLRDKNGKFSGRAHEIVPRAIRKRIQTELFRRLQLTIQEQSFDYIANLQDIASDTSASPTERMKASTYLLERVIGKVPEKVEVTAEVKPWEGIVTGITNDLDQLEEE